MGEPAVQSFDPRYDSRSDEPTTAWPTLFFGFSRGPHPE